MNLYWMLLGLGVAGLALSLYMTDIFVRVRRGEEVRCFDGTCPIVMKTSYAQALGFPNSYLAIPYYGVLTVFALLRLAGQAAWLFVPVAIFSGLSVAMSAYLAYILLSKLRQN